MATMTIYSVAWYWHHPHLAADTPLILLDFVILFLVFAVSLLVASLIGWKLAHRFIAPMHALAEAAKRVAKGDLRTRVLKQDDHFDLGEIGVLVDNFNTMAELLELARNDLNYQNSAIAHELRTPLAILKGRLQGLADGVFAPSPETYRSLLAHVDSLTHIVDDLRTLALYSANQLRLNPTEFDLSHEVEALVSSYSSELDRAQIRLELSLSPVRLSADRSKLRQVILALLDNSCRYAQGSMLTIICKKENGIARLLFSDDGPGLSESEIRQIFERFWRAEESRSRSSGGSGLGLAVVKAVVEAHGGSVFARQAKFHGLEIDLTFPLEFHR